MAFGEPQMPPSFASPIPLVPLGWIRRTSSFQRLPVHIQNIHEHHVNNHSSHIWMHSNNAHSSNTHSNHAHRTLTRTRRTGLAIGLGLKGPPLNPFVSGVQQGMQAFFKENGKRLSNVVAATLMAEIKGQYLSLFNRELGSLRTLLRSLNGSRASTAPLSAFRVGLSTCNARWTSSSPRPARPTQSFEKSSRAYKGPPKHPSHDGHFQALLA
ncbi:hypothetical protein EDB80DRAFT_243764 [Ilyonectria destructans]|nr:hypothetical protein EDB80DRAFT_243764 [Ilyonectria destructans]